MVCHYRQNRELQTIRHNKEPIRLSKEGKENCKKWYKLERLFNEAQSMDEKEVFFLELLRLKFLGESDKILDPKFDSLLWKFVHDERTFNYPFKSVQATWYVGMSEEGKVKMYSYEQSGGTAKDGKTFLQYIDTIGHLHLKLIAYPKPKDGGFLNPIFRSIKRTRDGYTLYGTTIVSSQEAIQISSSISSNSFKGGIK